MNAKDLFNSVPPQFRALIATGTAYAVSRGVDSDLVTLIIGCVVVAGGFGDYKVTSSKRTFSQIRADILKLNDEDFEKIVKWLRNAIRPSATVGLLCAFLSACGEYVPQVELNGVDAACHSSVDVTIDGQDVEIEINPSINGEDFVCFQISAVRYCQSVKRPNILNE